MKKLRSNRLAFLVMLAAGALAVCGKALPAAEKAETVVGPEKRYQVAVPAGWELQRAGSLLVLTQFDLGASVRIVTAHSRGFAPKDYFNKIWRPFIDAQRGRVNMEESHKLAGRDGYFALWSRVDQKLGPVLVRTFMARHNDRMIVLEEYVFAARLKTLPPKQLIQSRSETKSIVASLKWK